MPLVSKAFGDIITFTRASSATFVGSNGLIQSAAIDAPRFDYDPVTLAAKGLLIEEQRTNLLTYSEDFTNAAWVKSPLGVGVAPVVTANQTVAPDGTTTADLVALANTGTTSGDWSWLYQNFSASATTTYTYSVWVKASGPAEIGKVIVIVGALGVTTSVTLTADWQRVTITGTTVGAGTISVGPRLRGTETTATTASFFLWGAQLEAGSFATSYIPTVASQVTRSADVASVNTLSPWYNATEGTLYAEVTPYGVTADTRIAAFDDGSSSNRILIWGTSSGSATRYEVRTGAVTQVNEAVTSTLTANSTTKAAAAYKANDFAFSVNGGAAVLDASGTVPTVNKLNIGGSTGAPLPSGAIRRITYYPRRLSNAELQAITA